MSDQKFKILFLASSPDGEAPLRLDEEFRSIEQKINASEHRDAFDLISCWATRPDDFLQHLNVHRPTIVHFSGHGSEVGEIVLMDDLRQAKTVSPQALRALFTTLKDNIRLVVLNACYSLLQAKAIAEVIDCVIGMNDSIGDEAAIKFAASFYRAIGFGRSVKEAFEQSKVSLLLEGIPEENTPELLLRRGVDPASVYLIQETPAYRGTPASDTSSASSSQFIQQECVLDYGVASEIPVNEAREVLAMIRRVSASGLVDTLAREASRMGKSTSYTVQTDDVRTMVFNIFFPDTGGFSGTDGSVRLQVELLAPGLEVSDSPIAVTVNRVTGTPPLPFLVKSSRVGEQTLKVKVTSDDQELINALLRTKFVQHDGPGGPGGTTYVQMDDLGHRVLVLVETELAVRLVKEKGGWLFAGG